MVRPLEQISKSPAVQDVLLLDDVELKQLAKFLDVLMEVDFEIKHNEEMIPNASE